MISIRPWLGCSVLLAACGGRSEVTWTQPETVGVDILWVVDGSSSMGEEQETLATGFISFINELDEDDFRIAVTTMDTLENAGALVGDTPFLTEDNESFIQEFQDRAKVGLGGEDKEKGLAAAVAAVQDNADVFVREEALLVVVFVTDEEDCSDDGLLDGEVAEECYKALDDLPPVSGFVRQLQDAKEAPEMLVIGSIVGPKGACDAYPGRRYWQAAYQTGGLVGDICAGDWSRFLSDIGGSASGGRRVIPILEPVIESSVEVLVGGEPMDEGWSWNPVSCAVEFVTTEPPKAGAKVTVSYRVDTDAQSCIGAD